MSLKLLAKLFFIALLFGGAITTAATTGTPKFVGLGIGLAGLAGVLVLALFGGGGDPDKRAGSQDPPLRWGG